MHTAPHLLRQWALRLTSFDVAQIVAFTLIYLALGTLIRVAIQTAVVLSFGVRPDSLQVVGFAWRDLVMAGVPEVTLGYLATGAAFVVVGYALSRLEPRAPLATAVVVGLGLAITTAIAGASNNGLPLWLRITLPVLIGVGTVTGAAVRALRTSTGHRAVAS